MRLYFTDREVMVKRINGLIVAWRKAIKDKDQNLIYTYKSHYNFLMGQLDRIS